MAYKFSLLEAVTDNIAEVESFINTIDQTLISEKIRAKETITNQLLGHYNQLLLRIQGIILKDDFERNINYGKEVASKINSLEKESDSSQKLDSLNFLYDNLTKAYQELINKALIDIKTNKEFLEYNSLLNKINENIKKINNLNLSDSIIEELSSLYNIINNNIDIPKMHLFIEKTNQLILNDYNSNIDLGKGNPDERIFSLFAKINDQIINSNFLNVNNLVYASYTLEDNSKYYAIVKTEQEVKILDQSFSTLPNLILSKDKIIETCKLIIKNAGIYYNLNEYMRYIEMSYKTKMTKDIDIVIANYKRRLINIEKNIKLQLDFIDNIALLVNKKNCSKYPNIIYNDIPKEEYFHNYKGETDSKLKEIERLIIEVLLNCEVKSEFDTKSILKTLYDEEILNSLLTSNYQKESPKPIINTDDNIINNIDTNSNITTNSEKITSYLNSRLRELSLLNDSSKINVTITKDDNLLFKDINTVLDLNTAIVICDKVYKKGQGDYAVLDYLKTGNALKFTSKYKARDLATSVSRASYLKLLLENVLKKYIYIESSNGKDIIIDYLNPLLSKEKLLPKDIVIDLLNNEEMLKNCIKNYDYNFLSPLSDKSLKVEKIIKESKNLMINKATNMLVELKRIDNILD